MNSAATSMLPRVCVANGTSVCYEFSLRENSRCWLWRNIRVALAGSGYRGGVWQRTLRSLACAACVPWLRSNRHAKRCRHSVAAEREPAAIASTRHQNQQDNQPARHGRRATTSGRVCVANSWAHGCAAGTIRKSQFLVYWSINNLWRREKNAFSTAKCTLQL
ncbi:MAG: hypothetical protein Ta2A_19750 [Treponemataceae bacterium]|nr:MAG: hypothetical protein Ta2A_19750 [Treponemataceae bacterium]